MDLPATSAPLEPAGFGRGYIDRFLVTQPAAGAAVTIPLDPGFLWRLISVRFTLTTDANAANRFVSLDYVDPDNVVWLRNAAGVVWTANTSAQQFDFNAQRGVAEWAANTDALLPLTDIFLPRGFAVRINVGSIQAGDQLASIRVLSEKWLTGPAAEGLAGGGADLIPLMGRR